MYYSILILLQPEISFWKYSASFSENYKENSVEFAMKNLTAKKTIVVALYTSTHTGTMFPNLVQTCA